MSLHFKPNMVRLSVIGTGWSNTSIDSGDGFTLDGELLEDIACDLDYTFGEDVDWDLIADTEIPDLNWSDFIYKDEDGNIYKDIDESGVWVNPETGLEYPGNGTLYVPEESLSNISDKLSEIAASDSLLFQYSIPDEVIPTLYGGKVSKETNPTVWGSDRPHTYTPACWYMCPGGEEAVLFLDEPFHHGTANSGSIIVYDQAFSTRNGSQKKVYYSGCTTSFPIASLPSPYNSYPIAYVCWQCLYGSLSNSLVGTNDSTVTTGDIKNGTSGLESIEVDGKKYYKI